MFFSRGYVDDCLSRNVYRHPHRQQSPTEVFNKIHDIYALGVVLLEIGKVSHSRWRHNSNFHSQVSRSMASCHYLGETAVSAC